MTNKNTEAGEGCKTSRGTKCHSFPTEFQGPVSENVEISILLFFVFVIFTSLQHSYVCVPVDKKSHKLTALTEVEVDMARHRAGENEDQNLIYVVRAFMLTEGIGSTRSTWLYLGRSYSSRFEHELDVQWLTENHMGRGWRHATILRYHNQWFRVPVNSSHKPTPRLEVYPSLPSKAIPTALPPPACTADCLIKFFDHVGLESFREMFKSKRDQNPGFGKCCNIMRKMGKFEHRNLGSSVDPLESSLDNSVLYLFQIRAVNINTLDVDNSHAICIFNGLIYDANFDRPLDVNEINLDKVCVGDDSWVYDMMVRCARFRPTKKVKRFIFNNLKKIPMNINS